MLSRVFLLGMLSLCLQPALAEIRSFPQDYEEGKRLAEKQQGNLLPTLKNFKPESLFKNYTDRPPQAAHYGGVQQKEDIVKKKAKEEAETNPLLKQSRENAKSRPSYPVNKHAKNMQMAQWIIEHADELIRTDGCKTIPACETKYETVLCQEAPPTLWHYCYQQLHVDVDQTEDVQHYPIIVHVTSDRYYMGALIDLTTGQLIDHGPSAANAWIDGRLPASVDCNTLHTTITQTALNGDIDGLGFPSCGSLKFNIHVTHANHNQRVGGTVTLDIVSRRTETTINDRWEDGCAEYTNNPNCQRSEERCTIENETRIIGGIPITRACWMKEFKYTCQFNPEISKPCQPYRDKGCEQIGSRCQKEQAGQCILYEQTLRCPTEDCDYKKICTKEPTCISGDCTAHPKMPDPDFNQAIGSFSALIESAKWLDKNNQYIFSGEAASCSKAPIGFLNCCTDSGWGKELHEQCDDEEKKLKGDKEKHLTIEIPGDYCGHEVAGICTSWRKRYCVFPTRLSRLIQEKGRKEQLQIGFGTPKDPLCRGITIEEMQRIQFDRIDFSEIAEEIKQSLPTQDQQELIKRMKKRLEEIGSKR